MRRLLAVLALSVAFVLQPFPSHAQLGPRDLPIRFSADEVEFDRELGLVIARGNVEIIRADRTLYADTVTYNQRTDVAAASGNVRLIEPTGDVIFADRVELTGDLRKGTIQAIRLLMADRTRVAADSGVRTSGNRTEFKRAVFSPCELCKEDPQRAPLWQLKAVRVIHDQERHDIEYRDAVMEIFGVPVAYTPYFSHPDPTVERRSGFLAPSFTTSDDLGFIFRVPYYYAVTDHQDLTVEPFTATKENPGGALEYRQQFGNGDLRLNGSLTSSDLRTKAGRLKTDELRGHMRARANFDYDNTWRWGFDLYRVSDDTYLRRYDIASTHILTSNAFLEGFRGRNYAAANLYAFQGLRVTDRRQETPLVMPLLEYNFLSEPSEIGSYWSLDANAMSLTRLEGADTRRMSFRGGWHLPYIGSLGQIVSFDATLQSDLYSVSDVINEDDPTDRPFSGLVGRVFPQAALSIRYPLVRETGTVRQLIEPVAAVIAGPNGANSPLIPNEDSLGLEFDETDMLLLNRFSGVDRVDSGQRVDFGLNFGVFGAGGGSTTGFIGQSYRFRESSDFAVGTGLEDQLSDFVGRLRVQPGQWLDLIYRFRMDTDNASFNRNEIISVFGPRFLQFYANYLFLQASPAFTTSSTVGREQIGYGATLRITDHWSLSGATTRDIINDDTLSMSYGFHYVDECLDLSLRFIRRFFQDRDLQPEDKVVVQIFFKHLGEGRFLPVTVEPDRRFTMQ